MRTRWFMALGLVAAAGCTERGDLPVPGSEPAEAEPDSFPPRLDAAYYDPAHLLEVAVEMDPADFEVLRGQTRDIMDVLGGADCLAAPAESPYTWFHADVTVDGTTIEDVGLRKKGFIGSLSDDKPGLKVEFDEWVAGRELAGMERLTLNNNVQDPAHLRQCLGYGLLRELGLPAPRCNFARVTVNGEYLGVYSNVEPVKKAFLRQHFDSADGDLYEGTLSDLRPEWLGTFDPKTDDTDPTLAPLRAVSDALASDLPVAEAVGDLVDLDQFRRFWAAEVLLGHWDGYAGNNNNFFVYRDPTDGRIRFVPWGVDGIMRDLPPFGDGPSSVIAQGYLAWRLYDEPEQRARYLDALAAHLAVWDEDALLAEVDRIEDLILPELPERDLDGFIYDVETVRAFVAGRRDDLAAELPDGGDWPHEARGSPCLVDLGPVVATFDTTWESLSEPYVDVFNEGAGDLELTWDGTPYFLAGGAVAGEIEPGTDIVAVSALVPGTTELFQAIAVFPREALVPGAHPMVLGGETFGVLNWMDWATMEEAEGVAYVTEGTLTFDEASDAPGAPVTGRIEARLFGL